MDANRHLLDAGPLVALFDASDRDHAWCKNTIGALHPPLITCEAVLSETLFLLRSDPMAVSKIAAFFSRGLLVCHPVMETAPENVLQLMEIYKNVPMSLADACLVRMSEVIENARIVTLDSDFFVYRRNRRQAIPLLHPLR